MTEYDADKFMKSAMLSLVFADIRDKIKDNPDEAIRLCDEYVQHCKKIGDEATESSGS